ncbi:hypothetical protein Tco_1053956 [Tanacetum coccineum]|uniref:Uncharacterized protein n=1 Tax=Tanacetum coccineum TaxID=301880 RepID=A0ABQ5GVU3_9ASTR
MGDGVRNHSLTHGVHAKGASMPRHVTFMARKQIVASGFYTHDGKKRRESFYQHQEAGKQEKNQMGLLTMDDGIVNWGEHTEDEETNHALMAISSSSEKTLDSWKDSSKNLWRLINSGMSSNSKVGLGDSVGKPLYSRFIKTNDFKGVPHPLSGDYTPTPQEEIDESLYVYGKKGPQEPEPNVSDDRSKSRFQVYLQHVYLSTPIKPNEKERELRGNVNSFTKKKCFVYGSLSHLIKDCDYYEKKMEKRLIQLNGGRPNANSVRPNVNTGRVNVNSVRSNVNTGRTNVNPVRPTVNTGSSNVNTVNLFNQRRHFSKSHSSVRRPFAKITAQMSHSHAVKENWGSAVKTSAGYNWRNSKPHSNCDSGPTFFRTVNAKGPQGRPKPGIDGFLIMILLLITNELYNPVSLENQANPHAGGSEVTNSAGTSQTTYSNASEEKDEDVELIVVPSTVKNTEEKAESRKSSTNSKKEEILIEPQQEKEASSTGTSEDNPKILAFRRDEPVNTDELDPDDSAMPELEIFYKSETGIFDEASYDEEGVVTDFNNLPIVIEVNPTPTLRIHNIHPKSQILGDPKSAVQTRSKVQQQSGAYALISYIQKQQRNNHKDQHHCLFACFLSQE